VKKRSVAGFIIIAAVLAGVLLYHRYSVHILVWQANSGINVEGIKLMMDEEKVRGLLGKEEEHVPGFGGYLLKYQGKGIVLAFLNDADTDFYRKVNRIETTNGKHEVFGVRVGDDYEKALDAIREKGFTRQEEGFSGYWKGNMYIVLGKDSDKVGSISIGVRDRVASTRVY